jgi:hypothetical protein
MEDACKTKNPAVHCQNGGVPGVPRGNALARNVCARACAMFATANKQTCDFGLPKSVFLVRSLPHGKE